METSTSQNSLSNPYSSLLKEFREHIIDRETFYTALYTQTLRDDICVRDYRCQAGPEKPYQLRDSERKMLESCNATEDRSEAWQVKSKFYTQARERFKEYFKELDKAKAGNLSNRFFVTEIREFFYQRGNLDLVEIANEILRTYNQ